MANAFHNDADKMVYKRPVPADAKAAPAEEPAEETKTAAKPSAAKTPAKSAPTSKES